MTITLIDLKAHMRLEAADTTDDVLLAGKIAAAEGWCASFLGEPLDEIEGGVPAPVLEAIRQLAAHYYENREATSYGDVNTVPFGVISLLSPFRSWTF